MCMTVELTIFYSLNSCIRINLYFMILYFFFTFLHIDLQLRFVICISYNK